MARRGRPKLTPKDGKDQVVLKGYCGAQTRRGTICLQKAGFGTPHIGTGKCKWHGGNSPVHRSNAVKQDAVKFMGAPLDINPLEAIVWCIRITAGEVQWLSMKIAEADEIDWIENTIAGKQLNVFQRSRADAQDRLVRYSKDAIQLGLAERAIRMAENFGLALARMIEGIEADMKLTAPQRKVFHASVRKNLIMLQGGNAQNLKPFAEDPDIIEGEVVSVG
jgi:hypothetical protein